MSTSEQAPPPSSESAGNSKGNSLFVWKVSLALLALGSVVFAGHDLGQVSFWSDEAYSADAAHLPVSQIWDLSWNVDPHTLLWHMLLTFWYALYDGGELWGRLPSLLFGAGAVVATAELGRRLFNARAGFLAGIVLMLSASFVTYQHEARPYTLAALLTCAGMLRLLALAQIPTRRNALLAGVSMAIALYAHPFCALAFLSIAPVFIITNRKRIPKSVHALAFGWFAVISALFFALFIANRNSKNLSWVGEFSFDKVDRSLHFIGGTLDTPVLLSELAIIAAGVVITLARRNRDDVKGLAFALSWLALMPAIAFAIDSTRPVLVERYLMPAVPAFALVLAFSIDSFARVTRSSTVRSIATALTAVLLFAYVQNDNRTAFKIHNSWRDSMALIADQAGAGDTVFANHFDAVAVYYGKRHDETRQLTLVETGKTIDDSGRDAVFKKSPLSYEDITQSLATADHRVWLVSVIDDWDGYMAPYLEGIDPARLKPVQTKGSVRVEVLMPATTPTSTPANTATPAT